MPSDLTTNASAAQAPPAVLRLLREQSSMYDRLESLALRQRDYITRDESNALLKLLSERQTVTEGLTRIAKELDPIRSEWASTRNTFNEQQRAEADRLINDTRRRLERLIELDERDARLLKVRKQATASTLGSVHMTARAIGAYGTRSIAGSRFDRLDEGA